MSDQIHIIEPTLAGVTGHCFSFIQSLCLAAGNQPITVWCDKDAEITLPSNVQIKRYFKRRVRRIQLFVLYAQLLRQPGRIFVSTAGRTDMVLLRFASLRQIALGKVILYVHWFNNSPAKESQLKQLSHSLPNISIFAPTPSVCEQFTKAGFRDVRLVPYPITSVADTVRWSDTFKGLLYAGAARYDKGFVQVVDVLEELDKAEKNIPVRLQTSSQHYGKQDQRILDALKRLDNIAYPGLTRYEASLSEDEYKKLFQNAICLQLYNQNDFSDRISGVTLDALSRGCPIITLSGTWIARMVSEFKAGIVLETANVDNILAAMHHIKDNYVDYSKSAAQAGNVLQQRNNADYLFRELLV